MKNSLTELQLAVWNRRVPARYRFVAIHGDCLQFLHPTKGFRFIAAKRLGLAL